MKLLTHPAIVAFGLANLYLLDLTAPLVATDHDLVYHLIGSATPIFVSVVVYVVVLSLLITVLLLLAERPGRLRILIWSGILLAIPSILLHTYSDFSGTEIPVWLTSTVALVCLLAIIAISLSWRNVYRRFEVIQPIVATVFAFFAFSSMLLFAQLIWNGWQARALNPAPNLHHVALDSSLHQQRVIWILLDELSYQQVFERRFPGLDLPAFDRLAAQSTVFTHAVPTGEYTRYILPTLFTGVAANAIDVSASGALLALRDPSTEKWRTFRQHDSVFQDAIDAGYSTAIAGWYNPYCRIMPEVLDHCYWTYREFTPANLSSHRSLGTDLVRPFRNFWRDVLHVFGRGRGTPSDETRDLREHSTDYRKLLAAGDVYLADPSIDFLFLHMPIPHPYGFYDRTKKAFATKHTSYIDNLALADLYLAHVREVLEEQHQWDSSTILVMGDHSWRTSIIWVDSMTWTDEDEAASHGGEFDTRPAYLVKLPNQQTGAHIDQPFAAIHTRALLDAVLRDQIHTPADLQTWAAQKK